MFAILETGSKQYKVEEGDILEVELVDREKISEDNIIDFDSVLLVKDTDVYIGQPFVKSARIRAKILEEIKAPKVIIFKKKSKKQYKKTRGHRQKLHRIQIEKIEMDVAVKEKPAKKVEPEKETVIKTAEKPGEKVEAVKKTKIKTAAKPKIEAAKETKTKTPAKAKPKAETGPGAKAKETKTATTAKARTKPKTGKKVEKKEKE